MIGTWLVVLAGPVIIWEEARQLYTAAMQGRLRTGRSMIRIVSRETEPKLFRRNVVAHLFVLPLVTTGWFTALLSVLP